MAALADRPPLEIVDLNRIASADLDGLLKDEILHWREQLHWDFSSSADLVRQYVGMNSLGGCALLENSRLSRRVVGYGYFVHEDHKALIGDLYVAERAATRDNEYLLLDAILNELRASPAIRRVECQLLMFRHGPDAPDIPMRFPGERALRAFARNFMSANLAAVDYLEDACLDNSFEIVRWNEGWNEESAHLMAACYASHIDSQINDQYRTPPGARKFLANVVQFPGCGRFFAPASLAVFDRRSRALCGLALASLVADRVGHITQICVAPWAQNRGLGQALMRQSLRAMADAGCDEVTLTVTASNVAAVRLYQRLGFHVVRRFSANVWDWS